MWYTTLTKEKAKPFTQPSQQIQKTFNKIKHPFVIKTLTKVGIEGTYLNIIKAIYDKSEVKVTQSCPTLCDPMDYTIHETLQARILEWAAIPFYRGFPTQELNPGLPHCRQILYQLSHQGNQIYDKHTPIKYSTWKAENLPQKIWNKERMPVFTTSHQHSIESLRHSNQMRKRNKRYSNGCGKGKIAIICRQYIIYRKPYRLHTKSTKTDKWIQQGSRIQD